MKKIYILTQPVEITEREIDERTTHNPCFWRSISKIYAKYAQNLVQYLYAVKKPADEDYAEILQCAKNSARSLQRNFSYISLTVTNSVEFENYMKDLYYNEYYAICLSYKILSDCKLITDEKVIKNLEKIFDMLDGVFELAEE